jgi:tRNA threonylcarbamoyladenosine biosynthesis protein TsaB
MTHNDYFNVLAIDTSTHTLKLALSYGGDRLVKAQEKIEKSHGQYIMNKIEHLFRSAELEVGQLEAIAACTGPGSFTGLRIGLAVTKGMAVALDIPVVGVSLFEVAALKLKGFERRVRVVIPLNREECFTAVVEKGTYDKQSLTVITYPDLVTEVKDHAVAGIGIDLSQKFPQLREVDVSHYLAYDGSDILSLGVHKLSQGQADDLAGLEPLYVRKSQAELRFEQRRRQQ